MKPPHAHPTAKPVKAGPVKATPPDAKANPGGNLGKYLHPPKKKAVPE